MLDNRWVRRLLPAALIASLLLGGWQYLRWWRTESYWARQYVGVLQNAVIGIDRVKGISDPAERSSEMAWIYGRGRMGFATGEALDVMVQNGYPRQMGILGRVDYELAMFSRELWAQRGLKPPEAGSQHNDLLTAEDLDKLHQIWVIYRDHFDQAVVNSSDYERQRRALIAVHQQLREQGLTALLAQPDTFDAGL